MVVRCPSCFREYESEYGMCPHCGYSIEDRNPDLCCLLPGTEISDRYIIGGMLGLGGFGITYRAWDKKLEIVVAIKEYFPSGLVNRLPGHEAVVLASAKKKDEVDYNKKRFLEEAQNLARFNTHPNIVNVYDYFEENNTAYIVMEYLDGKTLSKTILDNGKPLAPDLCICIAQGICEALRTIHAANILHRDVSPDNIFLCKNGKIKLIDFGAARFNENQDTRLTIVVKPGFAPPEQYERINKQGPWTDVYALGATLYYALTGQRPLESTDRKVRDELIAPAAVNPIIPDDLSTAVMRAMAIDIPFRYSSVNEFEQALSSKIEVVSVEKEKKRRKTKRVIGMGAMILVIVAILAVSIHLWQSRQMPEADLVIWYMLSGNTELDAEKEAALQVIASQFMDEYHSITISLKGVEEDQYLEALEQAEEPPDLFESTSLNSDALNKTIDLDASLDRLEEAGGFIEAASAGSKQYPTGMTVPLIFVNTSLGTVDDFSTLDAVKASCTAQGSRMSVSLGSKGLYSKLYGDGVSEYCDVKARGDFLSGKTLVYFGSSADYEVIQEQTPGLYAIHFPDTGSSAYDYSCLWSISETEQNNEKAAIAFLEFLTSDVAQDYLHIQHLSESIPITQNMLDEYLSIHQELSYLSTFLANPVADH